VDAKPKRATGAVCQPREPAKRRVFERVSAKDNQVADPLGGEL
jgi:hypothetical protein